MNRKKLTAYGQEFEDEDEEGTSVSKKPVPIHEEIVTDEKGKRRFHGAFTGGFSAGYWNTVGSKQGWVPQQFSSSRDARGDKFKQKAEDFMDAEDLGEFGIGNRSIKQTATFGDFGGSGQKRKMAWERESVNTVDAVAQLFDEVVKPVSNSIGARMLRSMGWREGRGIGLTNVKQKQQRGGQSAEADFDREQASKIAPSYEFGNEDALVEQLTPLTGAHGIGYQGLRQTTVLDESYGRTALALKSGKKNSKGIKGQAFGVGAFEEEDESVYTNYDLSQFDFSLDVTGASDASDLKTQKIDTAFELQPKRLNPRKFYAPPRVPSHFRPEHRPIPMDISRLPRIMKDDVKKMNALQRAKFLGEDRKELIEGNKEKPKERRSRWDIKADEAERRDQQGRGGEADEERDRRQRNRVEFPDEPMRQTRFKEFLQYLRRGLPYPQPTDLTLWEWEWEKKEFESKLTSEERGMLPEVQSRSQPLAKTAIAAPIFEAMASKFVKEAAGDLRVGTKDEDKLAAVKMEMFGEKTRMSFEWYPDNILAKRFNVPNPYPGAEMVGVPALQKNNFRKKDTLAEIGGMAAGIGMPNTANEVEMRERLLKSRARRDAEAKKKDDEDEEEKKYEDAEVDSESDNDENEPVEKEEKAPKSFFESIFGDIASSSDDTDSEDERREEEEVKKALEKRAEEIRKKKEEKERKEEEEWKKNEKERKELERKEEAKKKGNEEDDDEIQIIGESSQPVQPYGPSLPPSKTLNTASVLKYLQEDLKKKKSHKKEKKSKKSSHKKSHKKSKKSKKEKKRRRSSSDSDSDSDDDGWEEKKK